MSKLRSFALTLFLVGHFVYPATAQLPSGGGFTLEQSVIANGGGLSSGAANNIFKINGTPGQPVAGTNSTSTSPVYSVRGGFWQSFFTPTAAMVSVGGRVLTADGRNVIKARVVLTDGAGVTRSALSNQFGYYRIDDIEVGQVYIVSVSSKLYQFVPRTVQVSNELTDVDIIALP